MSGFLAFPLGIPPYTLKSATSQRGGRMGAVVPGAPTDVLEVLAQVVDAGDVKTATTKISFDGGTNWKGRKVDTTWD